LVDGNELPKGVLAYKRKLGNDEVMVLMNFTKAEKDFALSGNWNSVFSVNKEDKFSNGKVSLGTYGGMILKGK
jgi:hypothetical protein